MLRGEDISVVVVGAGPTGLTVACELARQGASCRVLERGSAQEIADPRSMQYRAIGIHRRSLEILSVMGIVDLPPHKPEVPRTTPIPPAALIHTRRNPSGFGWPPGVKPYGGRWMRQAEIQQRLIAALADMGVEVEFGREVTSIRQTPDRVVAISNGEEIAASWLVGADGGRSTIRKECGLAFDGVSHPFDLVIADVELRAGDPSIDWGAPHAQAWLKGDTPLWVGPLPGHPDGRRMVAPVRLADERVPAFAPDQEAVEVIIADRSGDPTVRVERLIWAAKWRMSERMVETYRVGRVLLAGDAAHVHSPVGGQGMNTGLQDGYNLGWKLAMVTLGRADERLLDTYEAERLPVASGVLRMTRQLHRTAIGATPLRRVLRDYLIVPAFRLRRVREVFLRRLSQLNVHYRQSWLSSSQGSFARRAPRPGDRAPEAECLSYPKGQRTSLLGEARGSFWQLLILTEQQSTNGHLETLENLVNEVTRRYGGQITPRLVVSEATLAQRLADDVQVLVDEGGAVREAYAARASCMYLIRPDGYIGLRSDLPTIDRLEQYLRERSLMR